VTSDQGTGIAARVPGFFVGGKTGTAQKIKTNGRGYMQNGYIGSFAGFIPANEPKFVIYVAIDHPRKGFYGATVAAPLFSRIASYAVRRDGVSPELLTETTISPVKEDSLAQKFLNADKVVTMDDKSAAEAKVTLSPTVPNFKSLTVREVLAKAAEEKIEIKLVGDGRVDSTWPDAGQVLTDDRHMTVFLK
jgi:cell division protein FtsI (penicillin-binding protein 3)